MLSRFIGIITLIVLISMFSCSEYANYSSTPKLSISDSIKIAEIEKVYKKANFDSVALLIKELTQNRDLKNEKLLKLKINDVEARVKIKYGEPQAALDIINQILLETEKERTNYNNQYVSATLLKGYIYYGLGDYKSAYKYYYEARESSYGKGEKCEFAVYDYRISLSLYRQNNFDEAIENFKKSFINYGVCYNRDFWTEFQRQEILNNIGLCYFKMGKYDSSLFYYDSALSFIKQTYKLKDVYPESLEVAEGVIYGNIGKLYIKLKKYDKAIPLLLKNVEINSKPKYDNRDEITSRVALGEYYLQTKQYKKLENILTLPSNYYSLQHFKKNISEVLELKSRYFVQRKQFDSALLYRLKYDSITSELITERQRINDSDVQLTLESLEKENQLNKLNKENQQKAYVNNIIIGVLIASLLLLIIIYVFYQISKRKNLELKQSNDEVSSQKELLKNANDVLKQRDLEKNKILSIVAHDLRNPNNAISSIANTLKEYDNLTEEQLEYLELIEISANSNRELIKEILRFAKPGQFDTSNEYKIVSCNDFLNKCVVQNRFKSSAKKIDLVYEEIDTKYKININEEKFKRAITNLIVNAIKFSEPYSKIRVYSTIEKDQITIHVQDEGIGIPDHLKEFIFKSDPKIRRAGTEGESSIGIGLSIVKQIVEEHFGKIDFISEGKGTTFFITLQLHKQS